jgi:hypothetical protein
LKGNETKSNIMPEEFIERFESLDCHKEFLIEAAYGNDEEIWVNLCSVYRLCEDQAMLRKYICSHYQRPAAKA